MFKEVNVLHQFTDSILGQMNRPFGISDIDLTPYEIRLIQFKDNPNPKHISIIDFKSGLNEFLEHTGVKLQPINNMQSEYDFKSNIADILQMIYFGYIIIGIFRLQQEPVPTNLVNIISSITLKIQLQYKYNNRRFTIELVDEIAREINVLIQIYRSILL